VKVYEVEAVDVIPIFAHKWEAAAIHTEMAVHFRVFLDQRQGGEPTEHTLSFENTQAITLNAVREQLHVEKDSKLQIQVGTTFLTARTDKDVATQLKQDCHLKISKRSRVARASSRLMGGEERKGLKVQKDPKVAGGEQPVIPKRKKPLKGPIFGVELGELMERQRDGVVPLVVEQTIQWLRAHGNPSVLSATSL